MMGRRNESEMEITITCLSLIFFRGFFSVTKRGFEGIIFDFSVLTKHRMR